MFNMLNTRKETGNNSPLVCKFLAGLTAACQSFLLLRQMPLYLVEKMGLSKRDAQPVGLRIAFFKSSRFELRFRKGKG
jgi:hypothetical protein